MVETAVSRESTAADTAAARRVAKQMRWGGGQRGTWIEVRSLMSEFGIDRLSETARGRITSALEKEDLETAPPLAEVTRRDTVVLSWLSTRDAAPTGSDSRPGEALDALLTLRVATPGAQFGVTDLETPVAAGVRWFDLAKTNNVDVDEFLDVVNPHCDGALTREMVLDLLTPDPRPKVTMYDDGAIRGASAFRVTVEESDEAIKAGSLSKAGVLVFDPVEMIVAKDWVISCWHDAEVFRGADRIGERPQRDPANLAEAVDRAWRTRNLSTGGDIATALLYELSLSFKPAVRELQMAEEEWELDFFRRPERIDRDTLLETHAEATVLRDWLVPLNRSGMRLDAERAWFPMITGTKTEGGWERALGVDDRVSAALKVLNEIGATLRTAYDLLHLRLSGIERARDEKFQRRIALGGAAILIPTLLAGVMGANTWVPGEYGPHSSHWPFYVLLALIVLFALGAWFLLARTHRESDAVTQEAAVTVSPREARNLSGLSAD